MPRIVAFDQSYTCTGVARIVDGTVISWDRLKFPAKASKAQKRELLRSWACQYLYDLYKDNGLVVIEQLWTIPGASVSAALIDVTYGFDLEVKALNPRVWKKKLLGSANAPKSASIQFASELIGREIDDDNIADAICIARTAYLHPDLLKKAE